MHAPTGALRLLLCFAVMLGAGRVISAQAVMSQALIPSGESAHRLRAERFLRGRTLPVDPSALLTARTQAAALAVQTRVQPDADILTTAWQPLGPNQIASLAYGKITGRVTSIAIDPADHSGNTVYVGTTGGGIWKSTNAAGPAASVTFAPLTDTLPVFSANAGAATLPSLSIGALAAQPNPVGAGVLLAGTGDTNDASDSYYGEGILRSADGGVTWTLAFTSNDGAAGIHLFTGMGVAGIAWSTASPQLAVAAFSNATEGDLVSAASTSLAVKGLYYSTDAGVTWHMATLQDGAQIVQQPLNAGANHGGNAATAVVWDAQRQRFYAAIRYHGYYQSADGVTWTRLASQPGTGLTTTACPANPGLIGSTACPIFRGALAAQPVTGDLFALTVDAGNNDQGLYQDLCGLSGSACSNAAPTFAVKIASAALELGTATSTASATSIPQADYNLTLAAASTAGGGTDTLLFAGTQDLFSCAMSSQSTAGCTLRNTTNATNGCASPAMVAPAQHALAALASPSLLFIGNDGGLWRSTDGVAETGSPCAATDASHFDNLNGGLGSLAESVSLAQDPAAPDTLLLALGADGTAATSTASALTPWAQLTAGEGGGVAIDPMTPQNWLVATAAGVSLTLCTKGSACTAADFAGPPGIGPAQTNGDGSLANVPFLLDPLVPSNVLLATCRAYRGPASGGSLWTTLNAISKDFSGVTGAACTTANGYVRSLAAGGPNSTATAAQNAGATVLYAGMAGALDGGGTAGGHLFATTHGDTANSTTPWSDLAAGTVTNDPSTTIFNPGHFDLSSLYADPHDATGLTLYATVMGFANTVNTPHLYRTKDGGATWQQLTSNLPNAPANSVVVDPNDAQTVYIALDTGVYETRAIDTCATANCWSTYGTALPNAPVIQLLAGANLPTNDGTNRAGMLRAATYGRGIWQIPLLTAATILRPAMSLSPPSLSFGTQAVNTASAAQTITVTNTGTAPLTVSNVAITGDFSTTNTCTAAAVAPGGTCTVTVTFLPTMTGTRAGLLTIYGNVTGGQATATLTGTATTAASMIFTPIALIYNATTVGNAGPAQNIAVSNTGGQPATLTAPVLGGANPADFTIALNTCGTSLAADVGCTLSVVFNPKASGARSATITMVASGGSLPAGGVTLTASLSGTGNAPATDTLTPLSLTFGPQVLNTTSATQNVTLTNDGDVALQLISAQITAGEFTVANACGTSLNAHASCALAVAYAPKSLGAVTGTLTVSDQFRSQTVRLNGTGLAPAGVSLAPTGGLSFAATPVGSVSAAQTVTLTNNGGVPLTLSGVALTGDFTALSSGNTCGATLAASASCTVAVVFTPSVGGPRNGSLTFTDSAANSPQSLPLTGIGVDFTLVANGATSVTVASGGTATYPLLLRSDAAVSGMATLTCAGAPAHAVCTVAPASAALGGTTNIAVTVQTGSSLVRLETPRPWRDRLPVLAAFVPLLFCVRRKRWASLIAIALAAVVGIGLSGCGTARTIPDSGATGTPTSPVVVTPTGTYTLTVSATSGGLTRTVPLTLIIQ